MKTRSLMVTKGWIAAAAIGCVLAVSAPASACPHCSETTADTSRDMVEQGNQGNPALGYALSIIFLLGVPFSLLGGMGYAVYRQHVRGEQSS